MMQTSKIGHVTLRAAAHMLPAVRKFYGDVLGMSELEDAIRGAHLFQSGAPESCGVEFVVDPRVKMDFKGARQDNYWKIGLALDDVDSGAKALEKRLGGGGLSRASQFLDVGYLMHISDPVGFPIELLQTTFEDATLERQRRVAANLALEDGGPSSSAPFGAANPRAPVVGQITIRANDIDRSLAFYRDRLGMTLLCKEDVSVYGFWLYFLGYPPKDEQIPNAQDLNAVENREWCYQRPYTTLEIQVPKGGGVAPQRDPIAAGCDGITFYVPSGTAEEDLADPDGLAVHLRIAPSGDR